MEALTPPAFRWLRVGESSLWNLLGIYILLLQYYKRQYVLVRMHSSPRHFGLIREIIRIGNHTNHTFFSRGELFTLEIVQLCSANLDRMSRSISFFSCPMIMAWQISEMNFKVHLHTKKFCEVLDRAQNAHSMNLRRILKDVCGLYQFWFFLRLKTEYLFSRLILIEIGRFTHSL